jgi:hypothetical protein
LTASLEVGAEVRPVVEEELPDSSFRAETDPARVEAEATEPETLSVVPVGENLKVATEPAYPEVELEKETEAVRGDPEVPTAALVSVINCPGDPARLDPKVYPDSAVAVP